MMKKMLFLFSIMAIGCKPTSNSLISKTVKEVDLSQYKGSWYEIARIPIRQEKDLVNVTATYAIDNNDKISVVNSGYNKEGERKQVYGKAWQTDPENEGNLMVQFFWPFRSNYLILFIDNEYQKALVSSRTGKYAWILSKQPSLSDKELESMMKIAHKKGIDTTKFEIVEQKWN